MVVKLGVNRLEARIPSANPIIESSSGILLLFLYFKAATESFSSKAKHRQWYYYQYRFILLFKSSSESVRRIISSFIGILLSLKLLNTLPLLTYQHSNYLRRQQSNVLHPKSISAA
jgi:hypothetical protein